MQCLLCLEGFGPLEYRWKLLGAVNVCVQQWGVNSHAQSGVE